VAITCLDNLFERADIMLNTNEKTLEQLKTDINLSNINHPFVSQITTARLKNNTILINASQNAFSPFRIYTIEIKIINGSSPGTYPLDGQKENTVGLTYVPPNTNVLNFYRDSGGEFTLNGTASEHHVNGTFRCTAKSVNTDITDEATLTEGVVSFSTSRNQKSSGFLQGTVIPGEHLFYSTTVTMSFVEPDDHPHFLEVIAVDDVHGDRRLYLHIPKSKLGQTLLPITDNEDGRSALATLLFTGVHRGTRGSVIYNYDEHLQKLTGDLTFEVVDQDQETIEFKSAKFEIIGLSPVPIR
jgi:hypothetical protein